MSVDKDPKSWKIHLTVSLLLKVLVASYTGRASAESLSQQYINSESLLPLKLGTLTLIHNNTAPDTILSQVSNPPQVPNPVVPIPPPPQPVPSPQPSPKIPLNETPVTPPAPEERQDIPGRITVERFEFEGNTVFDDKKLAEVTAGFTKQPLTFSQLLQIEAVITKLYTDAGYINSGAFVPADQNFPQQGAVVKIEIVEGGIEEIKITGTRRLNQSYVRNRVKLGTSGPLNRDRLLKALQLLQLNPLIERVTAELSTGSVPEQSVLEVRVDEADSFRTELFVDNGRAPSVGSFRRGIRISEGNVFGLGDSFAATYTNTDGSNALDLSYNIPFNARNGSINLTGGFSDTTVVEPPFNRAEITGDYFYIDVGIRQPIIQTLTQELALGLSFSRQQSQTEFEGVGIPLSSGAGESGQTRISALRFVQEYTQRSQQQVFALRSQFSLGTGWFDSTFRTQPPDSRFFSWRGQGQYVRRLAPDTLILFRSDIQLATRALVPLEQFGVGGLISVRGYRQDELLVDNGFFASLEARLPILRVEDLKGVLQIAPFVDFGIGWNSSDRDNPDPNALVGIGLGLQWQMSDTLTARVDYGIPLTDVESGDRTLQERGFYFSVNFSPF